MCKGWALQVVQRRPDTAGAPGSWTRRGLQGTLGGDSRPDRPCQGTWAQGDGRILAKVWGRERRIRDTRDAARV